MRLGTWGSYGIEKLKILPGEGWEGLTITATFVTPTTSTRMLVPEDGIVTVPPEATANVFTAGVPARIVFSGVADGVQRITTDLPYRVSDHAPIEGDAPTPTPSEWEQFVAQVQGAASDAKKSATEAADSASAAAGSATQAAQSAEKAAISAQSAEKTLEQVQATGNSALQSIGDAKSDALSSIGTAQTTAVDSVQQTRQSAVQAVEQAGTTQVGAVNTAGQAQQTTIQQAGEDATQHVQDAGTEQVNAVNAAGDAKLQQIEEVNALLPTPTEEDAGKAPIAQPDGTYALEQVTVDAYTKTASDGRYAPIGAAIKVSGKGTGLVNLSPTVSWGMQGLKLYGRSWQDGTPSVETPAPIQSAGQDGQIDVTVAGANLADVPDLEQSIVSGVAFSVSAGTLSVSGIVSGGTLNTHIGTIPVPIIAGKRYYLTGISKNLEQTGFPQISVKDASNNNVLVFQLSVVQNGRASAIASISSESGTIRLYGQAGANFGGITVEMNISPDENTDYAPFQQPQQLPVPTPGGLPGIPVNSGGNWTDDNGQQWVSDVVDLAAKIKTQYCAEEFLSGTPNFKETSDIPGRYAWFECLKHIYKNGSYPCLVSIGKYKNWGQPVKGTDVVATEANNLYFSPSVTMTEEEVNAKFAELIASDNPPVILGQLATPITTPLDTEILNAYKALQSYPGTTNVLAPDCGIEAAAVAEPTQYIENRIQSAITQAVTQAVAITGGNT